RGPAAREVLPGGPRVPARVRATSAALRGRGDGAGYVAGRHRWNGAVTSRRLRIQQPQGAAIAAGIVALREELALPAAFPPEVEAAAAAAAQRRRLPALDRSDLPLLTIDPPGAMDLDQALHVERRGDGYRVHYAIADVAAFAAPADPVDREAQRRGQTLYGADTKIPLHPTVLSEGAA